MDRRRKIKVAAAAVVPLVAAAVIVINVHVQKDGTETAGDLEIKPAAAAFPMSSGENRNGQGIGISERMEKGTVGREAGKFLWQTEKEFSAPWQEERQRKKEESGSAAVPMVTEKPMAVVQTQEPEITQILKPTDGVAAEMTVTPELKITDALVLRPTGEPELRLTGEPGLQPTTEPELQLTAESGLRPTTEPELQPTIEPGLQLTAVPDLKLTETADMGQGFTPVPGEAAEWTAAVQQSECAKLLARWNYGENHVEYYDDGTIKVMAGTVLEEECIYHGIFPEEYTKIIVCEGVLTLSEKSFIRYENIKDVYLPTSLKTVEAYAFYYTGSHKMTQWHGLRPEQYENVGAYAFAGCTGLERYAAAEDGFAAAMATPTPTPQPTPLPPTPTPNPANPKCLGSIASGESVFFEFWDNGTVYIKGKGATQEYGFYVFDEIINEEIYHFGRKYMPEHIIYNNTFIVEEGITRLGKGILAHMSDYVKLYLPSTLKSISSSVFSAFDEITAYDRNGNKAVFMAGHYDTGTVRKQAFEEKFGIEVTQE